MRRPRLRAAKRKRNLDIGRTLAIADNDVLALVEVDALGRALGRCRRRVAEASTAIAAALAADVGDALLAVLLDVVAEFRDVLAVGLAFGNSRPNFTTEVLRNFTLSEQVKPASRPVRHPDSPTAAVYEVLEFDDPGYSYSIYVGQTGTTQVAVIYYLKKGQRSNASIPITMSMESSALGADADRARRDYDKQKRTTAAPKK